jgi:SAM-dependent methyltransferase
MHLTGYDTLAAEYYDNFHKTCRNFDMATRTALDARSASVPKDGLILEVGCGRGRSTEFLSTSPDRVVQLDSSREMLALHGRETSLLKILADATSVPFFDEQFKAVVGFLVDPFVGMCFFGEAFRLLVGGGLLLFTTPTADWGHSLRGEREPQASLARFLTKNKFIVEVPSTLLSPTKLEEMLSHSGFKEVLVTDHCLPDDAECISPDVQSVADKRGIAVSELPIIHLITAFKPR